MTAGHSLLLYGVFRELVSHRVSLGVTDYLDAVRALQTQMQREDATRFVGREHIRRLCHVMWARSPDEVRLIDRVIDSIAPPDADDVTSLARVIDGATPPPPAATPRAPGATGDQIGESTIAGRDDAGDDSDAHVGVSFEPIAQGGGVALPYPVLPRDGGETFVLQPQTVMSPRALAVLWRRYRRMMRSGPRTELDFDATMGEYAKHGLVHRPVLRPGRANTARLLILADASPSMSAWRPFLDALAKSVALSRLHAVRLLYFANVPRRLLYESVDLGDAVPARATYEQFAGSALLVVSDCGAARGLLNRARVDQTRTFLADANRRMRSVVWINPMPDARWPGTTADAVASGNTTAFLPLAHAALIRAIDILRGARTR